MTEDELSTLVLKHLGDRTTKPGAVLYSSVNSIQKAPFYLMGFNPGGTADHTDTSNTIGVNLCAPPGTNHYADQWWGEAGLEGATEPLSSEKRTPLQACVCNLFDMMKMSPRDVPSTNIIFARSNEISGLQEKASWKALCWPVHKAMLSVVQPNLIITLGIGATFSAVLAQGKAIDRQEPVGDPDRPFAWARRMALDFGDMQSEITVLGVVHPSDRGSRGAKLRKIRRYPDEVGKFISKFAD